MAAMAAPGDDGSSVDGLNRILVIGGEGFLGHWLLKDLHSRYGSSAVLFSSSRSLRFPSSDWQWLPCDLTSSTSIASLLSQTGAKTVILAAASHFESTREQAFRVNVTGTQTVVDACRQAGVKRFVYTSSTAAIFAGKSLIDAKEDETPYVTEENVQSYYGLSKAKGEIITIQANGRDGMYTTAIRPASFTGPGDTTVVPQAMQILKSHQAFIQIGDDNTVCDWDSVHNVNHGIILALEHLLSPSDVSAPGPGPGPGPAAGQIFHITCEEPLSVFVYLRKLWYEYNGYTAWMNIIIPYWLAFIIAVINEALFRAAGRKPTGLTRDTLIYATASRHHNIDKAKKLLGYKPVQSVEDHVKEAVGWYREEEAKERLAKAKAKMAKSQEKERKRGKPLKVE